MRYRILAIGKRSRDPLLDAADDYLERLQHYVPTELVRLREPAAGDRGQVLASLKPGERLVILDEGGRELDTVGLAERAGAWQRMASRGVLFVLGGAEGLPRGVKERADETLSLSRMTLPHRLALVLLVEQLYRVHTMLRGEPYHRA